MNSLYLLIPLSLFILLLALALFFWAVRSRQFEDMEGPAQKIVLDDMRDFKLNKNRERKPEDKNQEESES